MKELYNENHKQLKDTDKWKILYAHGLVESTPLWNAHATQNNVHIQFNPNKNSKNVLLKSGRKNELKIHIESQRTPNS